MKYMLMIYNNPATWETLTQDEHQAVIGEAQSIMKELMDSGEWVGGEGLADSSMSKTIRVRDGVPATTDGPFAEAKEQLAGYCLIECETQERALDIAVRWPDAKLCAVELRPLMGGGGLEM